MAKNTTFKVERIVFIYMMNVHIKNLTEMSCLSMCVGAGSYPDA